MRGERCRDGQRVDVVLAGLVVVGPHLDIAAVLEDDTLDDVFVRRGGRYDKRRVVFGRKDVVVGIEGYAGPDGDVVIIINAVCLVPWP